MNEWKEKKIRNKLIIHDVEFMFWHSQLKLKIDSPIRFIMQHILHIIKIKL